MDSLFASNALGTDAMSAMGYFAPMNHFLYALSIMLVSGSTLLYGLYLGKKPEAVHGVFSVDLVLSAALSALAAAALVLGVVTNVTGLITADEVQRGLLNQYLLGQAIGIPALVVGQQLFSFLSLENQTRCTMAASIICFVANAVMDYLFIVAIPMGTFGLGLASSISEWVFLAVQALFYLSGKSRLKFSLKFCSGKDALTIIRRGYSGALSRFVEMFRCIVVNMLIVKCVGGAGISSFAASNSFLGIIWALPFGMVAVARMLFSISIGEEDRRSLIDTMRVVFRRCVPLMCIAAAVLILFAHPITRLFYRDPSDPVYSMTVWAFRLLPVCMPPAVISLIFASYTQAAEKKVMSVVLPVIDGFVGVSADERLDITVRSIAGVEDISQQVMVFCDARGIDRRRAFFSGLAMEEMAGNIVLHGFTKDPKRKHSVDIRVIHKDDEIILRLRDDCPPFDPSDRARLLSEEDRTRNIGIRLVFSIATDVQYQNLLGLNVLTIRI